MGYERRWICASAEGSYRWERVIPNKDRTSDEIKDADKDGRNEREKEKEETVKNSRPSIFT